MNRNVMKSALAAAALCSACTTEETRETPEPWTPDRELSLSWPCLDCVATIGGGQCAAELDACEADLDCWSMFVGLGRCETMSALWTREETDACGDGAIYATTQDSIDLACSLYWCTWGYGNPPQEWLSCLQGGLDGYGNGCNIRDNAIMSHVADQCDWS